MHHDKRLVLSAIKNGQSYLVNYCAGKIKNFSFFAHSGQKNWLMGEETIYSKDLNLSVKLPSKAHIKLIKDGKMFAKCFGSNLNISDPGPGVYRVEVYKGNIWPRPWIFSNHIYLRTQLG
ncbi:hypothetical protein N752_02495 [Desulforamulus aquiferis]|nr:hypothetical protein [Desulforamulus aquiferis]RYD06555.1 hypothetical protein N752_02495 [Desulforamulus aquiferis]